METINFTREALYDLIWSKPLNAAAGECGVYTSVLRQLCQDQNIPLPWGGYKPGKERTVLPAGAQLDFPAAVAAAISSLDFPGETTASFIVPRKLADPDPLITAAQNTTKQDFQLHGMDHMLRSGFGELAIRASKANMDRALRIMDTLVKAWRVRSYRIVNQDKETTIYLREVSLRIGLRELTKTLPATDKYGSRRYENTGLLVFKVTGWLEREWRDGKAPLETHIQEILDHMEVAARDLEKIWANRKAEEKKNELEKQALAARIQENAEEKAAFEALVAEAQRWHQLQILDQYLDELSHNIPRSRAFDQWLSWARHRRRLFDPAQKRKIEH